jgi:acetyl esterase/lipase
MTGPLFWILVQAYALLVAANAWRPFVRRGLLSGYFCAAAWGPGELPLVALTFHLAANGIAAALGAFQGTLGLSAVILAIGTTLLLAGLDVFARRTAACYDAALIAALGAGHRDRARRPRQPGHHNATARKPGVLRVARIRRHFAHERDVSYGPHGRANQLDIWRDEDLPPDAGAPVLLQVPGGAYVSAFKYGQAYPLMSHLAEQGWVCVTINYRSALRHAWPAQIIDVKRALAWVRMNIAEYGGDPSFIAITGGSAGGHLAALAALTPNAQQWQPQFEHVDTSVAAAVPFYGVYDWLNRDGTGHKHLLGFLERVVVHRRLRGNVAIFDEASPVTHIGPDAPPFLISHGTADALAPVEQARSFTTQLREVSANPVVYAELPHAQHAFDVLGTRRATSAAVAVGDFLSVTYGQYRASESR